MNRQKLACLGLVLSIFGLLGATNAFAQDGLPIGWMKTGGKPTNYDLTLDMSVKHHGQASVCLQFVGKQPDGNVCLLYTSQRERQRH